MEDRPETEARPPPPVPMLARLVRLVRLVRLERPLFPLPAIYGLKPLPRSEA